MSQSWRFYLGIVAVFVVSLGLYLWLPTGDFIQQLAGVPVVVSLFVGLYQLARDRAAYDREMAVLDARNLFSLGASSHMANVAFDKHVEFGEEYVKETHNVLRTLFREGPTADVLAHTATLQGIRENYAVWLTAQMEGGLELFESALRGIGTAAHYVEVAGGAGDLPEKIASMY